jgi:hypothetical protein
VSSLGLLPQPTVAAHVGIHREIPKYTSFSQNLIIYYCNWHKIVQLYSTTT